MARIMEKFVPYIPPEAEFCTRSGKIGSEEVIPDGTDICWAYKFVDVLPDVGIYPHKICIPSVRIGSFQPGEVLTTEKNVDVTKWVRLSAPTKGVGIPTEITCVQSPDKSSVILRWKDPENTGRYAWKKTRVVRKFQDYPANENDGTVVVESTIRDQYWGQSEAFIDLLPERLSGAARYKVFAYSADGVVSSDDTCQVIPQSPEWGPIMSTQIQNGFADKIFHIGDEITLVNGSKRFSFEVIGFDMFHSTDAARPRSVALRSKSTVANLAFDNAHAQYILVTDEIAPAKGTKVYYIKKNGLFVVTSVPTGTHITSSMGIYVKETDMEAVANGSNKWSTSTSRAYLNGTFINYLNGLDSIFTSMILETNDFLDNVPNRVRLPTVSELEQYNLTGWSMTPNIEDTFKLWYRYYSLGKYYTELDVAKSKKTSYVILSIG